ncbi:hypothetical protein FORC41_3396 [Escherichia coli]|nr:hypothetical protein FORC41_3396 [Escherichia coli]
MTSKETFTHYQPQATVTRLIPQLRPAD